MDMTFSNKAMQAMTGFAIQLNKNSFGLAPSAPLSISGPLQPGQSLETGLPMNTSGIMHKMEPLMTLQVAVKNNVDVFYFACQVSEIYIDIKVKKLNSKIFSLIGI